MELLTAFPVDLKLWTACLGMLILLGLWLLKRLCTHRSDQPAEPAQNTSDTHGQGQLDALIADARRALADLLEATLAAVQEGVGSNLTAAISSAFEDKLAPSLKTSLEKLGKAIGAVHGLVKDGFPEAKQAVLTGFEQLNQLASDHNAALSKAVDSVAQTIKEALDKMVQLNKTLNGHVDDLHKHIGGTVGEILGLVKPMPGVVATVKNLSEKLLSQLAELKRPIMDTATVCQDNKQILQRMREEVTAMAEQVSSLHGKLDSLAEAVAELRERLPERPPIRQPPTTATAMTSAPPQTSSTMPAVQPVHFSIADHLATPAIPQVQQPPPAGPSPSAEVLLQQAMLLMQLVADVNEC